MRSFLLLFFGVLFVLIGTAQTNQARSVCSGETVRLTPTEVGLAGASFKWTADVTSGLVTGNTPELTGSPSINQTLTVSGNTIGIVVYSITPSIGNPFTLTVNVNPTNIQVTGSNITPNICSGSNFYANISEMPTGATTYTWTAPATTGTVGGAGLNPQASPLPYIVQPLIYTGGVGTTGTATYTVTPYIGGCANPQFSFTVTIRPSGGNVPAIASSKVIAQRCSGASAGLSPAISNAPSSVGWIRPSTFGISQAANSLNASAIAAESLNNTLTTPVTVYYFYSLNYSTGGSCTNTDVVSAVINPAPEIASTPDKTLSICSGSSFNFIVKDLKPADTRYTWTTPQPTGITGAIANGTASSSISQTLINNTASRNIPFTLTYTITPFGVTSGQSCPGATFQLTVVINPVSTVTTIPPTTVCSGQPFNFSVAAFPPNTTFTWALAPTITPTPGAITGGASQTTGSSAISQTLTNTTIASATATYVVTPTTGTCQGPNFNAVVTVNPTPSIASPVQPRIICSGSAFTNSYTGQPANTRYSWTVPTITPANTITGQTALTNQTAIVQTLTNTTNAPAIATYTIVPIAGACDGAPFTLDVTVNPSPNFPIQAATSCSGKAFKIEPANAPTGTTYTWAFPSQSTGISGGSEQTVAQSNISQILTNNSNTITTATYRVTASANGCTGATFNAVVTVNPLPIVLSYANSSCSGASFTSTPSSSLVGTTYTWALPISTVPGAITGGAIQSIPQTNITDVLTNTTLIPNNYVYTVTPFVNGCSGNPFTLTQTVKPTPIVTPIRIPVCSRENFSVTPSDVPFGTNYAWGDPTISPAGTITGSSTSGGASLSVFNQTLVNSSSSNGVALYTVTPTTNGCQGSSFTIEVTVKITANLSTQNTTICSGQIFDVKPTGVPTGTTYTWTDPQRGSNVIGGSSQNVEQPNIAQLLTYNGINGGIGTATYSVTPNSSGCLGLPFDLKVSIKPLPIVPDISGSVCSGINFTKDPPSSLPGTLYTWTSPVFNPLGSITGAIEKVTPVQNISQTLTNTTNAPVAVSYKVTPIADGCTGNSFTFVQNVNPTPTIATQAAKICSNTSFNVAPTTVPIGAATLYTWAEPVINPSNSITGSSLVNTPVTIISQSLTNTTNAVATATYDVTPVSGTCIGATFKVLVTVTPRAVIDAQSTTACSGTAFNVLPTSAPANTLYTWAEPMVSNGILGASVQNTPQASITQILTNSDLSNLSATANYTVTPITDGCAGNNFSVAVSLNSSNSTLSSTLAPEAVCSGTSFTYTPSSINTGTAFAWTRTAVSGISNAELNSFGNINEVLNNTTDAAITVAYTFTLSTNGCTNLNKQVVNVQVKPAPKLSSSLTPPAICSGATFSYAATSNTFNVVFNWSRTSVVGITEPITSGVGNINEALSNPTYSAVIVPYNFTLNANGCTNDQSVFVTVNPVLTVPDQNATSCSNASFNFKAPNTPDNTLYTWTTPVQSPGVSGGAPQTLVAQNTVTQLLINNANAVGTASYIVTPIIPATFTAGCVGRPFNLTVSVSPIPVLTSNLNPAAVCSGKEFNYTPTSNIPSAGFSWTRNSVVGISNVKGAGFNAIKETLLDTTTGPITVTYRYTLSAFGCSDTTSIVRVTVNASPILKTQVYSICSGSSFVIPNDLMPSRTTYTWGSPVVVPTASITGARNIVNPLSVVSDTLINTGISTATANYIIQPVGALCSIAPFNAVVTVKPAPNISEQETSACSGAAFSFTPANIPTGTTFTWNIPSIAPFGVITGFTSTTSGLASINQKLVNLSIDAASATYTVLPVSNGCIGNSFKLKVNVNPIPTTRISGPAGLCRNGKDSILVNFSGTSPWSVSYNDSKNGLPTTITDIKTSPFTIYESSLPNADTYTFKLLRVKDAYCSNDTSTVSLTQELYPLPYDSVIATKGTQLCVGATLPVTITGVNPLYQWLRNDTLINGAVGSVYNAFLPGLYSGVTVNTFGCYNKTVNTIKMVQVFNNPVINFSYDSSCVNTPIKFKNLTDTSTTGAIEWKWIFGGKDSVLASNTIYSFKTTGTQNIKLYASSAYCGYSVFKDSNILIRRPELPINMPNVFTYKNTPTALMARTFTGTNYKHKWVPSFGLDNANIINPTFNFNTNQVYYVNLISEYGCVTTDTLRVHVFENGLIDIFVPKSFSPNRDGTNDQLFVYLAGIKDFKYFKVFNKFGQLMFETRNADNPWDGRVNGTDQPLGAYVWIAEGIDVNGKSVTQKGTVMLLR
jgi:gliding motility-associated-like protein